MKKIIAPVIMTVVGLIVLTGCGSHYAAPGLVGLRYTHSITSGGKFKGCLEPGHKIVTNDKVAYYPTTQRQDMWETGNKAADHKDLQVTTKDGVQLNVAVNVGFYLNTACDVLRKFHETVGATRDAYFSSKGKYGQGWVDTMNYYVSPAVTNAFQDAVSGYTAAQLWPATTSRAEVQKAVQASLQSAVDQLTDGNQFFNKLTVAIYSVSPADPSYKTLLTQRQEAQTQAQTAESNKQAQITQAEADGAVKAAQAKAQAASVQAAIKGFQGPGMSWQQATDAYLKSLLIASGANPFQAQLMYPSTQVPSSK